MFEDPDDIPWLPDVREAIERGRAIKAAQEKSRLDREADVLAEANELVDAGLAEWIDTDETP